MPRTDAASVMAIVEVEPSVDLTPFIDAASSLVDRIEGLDPDSLRRVETWLAAHFYCIRDPRYLTEKTDTVGGTIESKVGLNLAVTRYGQMAMVLDTTGTLRRLSEGRSTPNVYWAGLPLESY